MRSAQQRLQLPRGAFCCRNQGAAREGARRRRALKRVSQKTARRKEKNMRNQRVFGEDVWKTWANHCVLRHLCGRRGIKKKRNLCLVSFLLLRLPADACNLRQTASSWRTSSLKTHTPPPPRGTALTPRLPACAAVHLRRACAHDVLAPAAGADFVAWVRTRAAAPLPQVQC